MKIQKKVLRGSMAIISEHIFPIYNEDHGAYHFYENHEHVDRYIEKCRNDFGLPSVTSEREWLKDCDDEGIEIPPKIAQNSKVAGVRTISALTVISESQDSALNR